MRDIRARHMLTIALTLGLAFLPSLRARATDGSRLSVAVTEPDVEAIVRAVGGDQVDTFSLFKGCILRKDLEVEPPVRDRLTKADAIVWTGFLNESAAVSAVLREAASATAAKGGRAPWIDVSKGAVRVNVPTSTCTGYLDPAFMAGNPFFWLDPENGAVIARNVAEGLGDLRPERRALFLKNAEEFRNSLEKDIARWREELKAFEGLRVFCTQCGWQYFSKLGGPVFVVCKGTPGVLPTPDILVEHVREMKAQVVLVDPNTPPEYGRAFRQVEGLAVVDLGSSLDAIPGARSYSALFDGMVAALRKASGKG